MAKCGVGNLLVARSDEPSQTAWSEFRLPMRHIEQPNGETEDTQHVVWGKVYLP